MMLARLRIVWVILLIGGSLAPVFAQDGTIRGVDHHAGFLLAAVRTRHRL